MKNNQQLALLLLFVIFVLMLSLKQTQTLGIKNIISNYDNSNNLELNFLSNPYLNPNIDYNNLMNLKTKNNDSINNNSKDDLEDCSNKISDIKNNIIINLQKNKLINYLSETKFKTQIEPLVNDINESKIESNYIINDISNKSDENECKNEYRVYFLNSNKIQSLLNSDYIDEYLYYDINCKITFTENNFLTRLFAKQYSDENCLSQRNSDSENKVTYFPKGVVLDKTEVYDNWKVFNVLLNNKNTDYDESLSKSTVKNKIIKVCLYKEDDIILSIVTGYDSMCKIIIDIFEEKGILKKDDKLISELDTLRNEVLRNKIIMKNIVKSSFISKDESYNIKETNNNDSNSTNNIDNDVYKAPNTEINYSNKSNTTNNNLKNSPLVDISEKLSVEELMNIKAILYFAKKNNVMKRIVEEKGDISLNQLINNNNKEDNTFKNNKKVISKSTHENSTLEEFISSQIKNITTSLLNIQESLLNSNKVMNYIKNEIDDIKKNHIDSNSTSTINTDSSLLEVYTNDTITNNLALNINNKTLSKLSEAITENLNNTLKTNISLSKLSNRINAYGNSNDIDINISKQITNSTKDDGEIINENKEIKNNNTNILKTIILQDSQYNNLMNTTISDNIKESNITKTNNVNTEDIKKNLIYNNEDEYIIIPKYLLFNNLSNLSSFSGMSKISKNENMKWGIKQKISNLK